MQKTATCSVSNVHKKIVENQLYLKFFLTPSEIRYSLSKKHFAEPASARIAAKKAVLSLLQVPASRYREWMHDIQIRRKSDGKPFLKFSLAFKKKFKISSKQKWLLSLAHERTLAIAWITVSGRENTSRK